MYNICTYSNECYAASKSISIFKLLVKNGKWTVYQTSSKSAAECQILLAIGIYVYVLHKWQYWANEIIFMLVY